MTGDQEVEVAIVINIGPGGGAFADGRERNFRVGKDAVIVAIEDRAGAGDGRTVRIAGDEQVGITVVVIIHPGDGAIGEIGK